MPDKRSTVLKGDIHCDKTGLIFEAYNIKDIDSSSCRIIFFDWLMSLDPSLDQGEAIEELLTHYTPKFPGHPMTELLITGLDKKKEIVQRRKRSKNVRRAI